MAETLVSSGALSGVERQHGQEEVGHVLRVALRPFVLLHENLRQAPRLQLGNVAQFT